MLSRLAKVPLNIPDGVTVSVVDGCVHVKGVLGELNYKLPSSVMVNVEDKLVTFAVTEESKEVKALSGTARALVNNMLLGVSVGFEKKLTLVGVGYRASLAGSVLTLALGYSHPIVYNVPVGIKLEVPSVTEIVIKGVNKEQVGLVAAVIMNYRKVELYKGKSIRYTGQEIKLKETKKK